MGRFLMSEVPMQACTFRFEGAGFRARVNRHRMGLLAERQDKAGKQRCSGGASGTLHILATMVCGRSGAPAATPREKRRHWMRACCLPRFKSESDQFGKWLQCRVWDVLDV